MSMSGGVQVEDGSIRDDDDEPMRDGDAYAHSGTLDSSAGGSDPSATAGEPGPACPAAAAAGPGDEVVFRLRIIELDHYLAPPQSHLDPTLSLFSSLPCPVVPVLRVFGRTPSGQSAALHVHGVWPYLYVELGPDVWDTAIRLERDEREAKAKADRARRGGRAVMTDAADAADADDPPPLADSAASLDIFLSRLGSCVERALRELQQLDTANRRAAHQQRSGDASKDDQDNRASSRPHLGAGAAGAQRRGTAPLRPFIHSIFIKMCFYDPVTVRRACSILQSGCILGECFSVFEAHIPYPLQFLADHGLYGMDFLDVGEKGGVNFRQPLPPPPSRIQGEDGAVDPAGVVAQAARRAALVTPCNTLNPRHGRVSRGGSAPLAVAYETEHTGVDDLAPRSAASTAAAATTAAAEGADVSQPNLASRQAQAGLAGLSVHAGASRLWTSASTPPHLWASMRLGKQTRCAIEADVSCAGILNAARNIDTTPLDRAEGSRRMVHSLASLWDNERARRRAVKKAQRAAARAERHASQDGSSAASAASATAASAVPAAAAAAAAASSSQCSDVSLTPLTPRPSPAREPLPPSNLDRAFAAHIARVAAVERARLKRKRAQMGLSGEEEEEGEGTEGAAGAGAAPVPPDQTVPAATATATPAPPSVVPPHLSQARTPPRRTTESGDGVGGHIEPASASVLGSPADTDTDLEALLREIDAYSSSSDSDSGEAVAPGPGMGGTASAAMHPPSATPRRGAPARDMFARALHDARMALSQQAAAADVLRTPSSQQVAQATPARAAAAAAASPSVLRSAMFSSPLPVQLLPSAFGMSQMQRQQAHLRADDAALSQMQGSTQPSYVPISFYFSQRPELSQLHPSPQPRRRLFFPPGSVSPHTLGRSQHAPAPAPAPASASAFASGSGSGNGSGSQHALPFYISQLDPSLDPDAEVEGGPDPEFLPDVGADSQHGSGDGFDVDGNGRQGASQAAPHHASSPFPRLSQHIASGRSRWLDEDLLIQSQLNYARDETLQNAEEAAELRDGAGTLDGDGDGGDDHDFARRAREDGAEEYEEEEANSEEYLQREYEDVLRYSQDPAADADVDAGDDDAADANDDSECGEDGTSQADDRRRIDERDEQQEGQEGQQEEEEENEDELDLRLEWLPEEEDGVAAAASLMQSYGHVSLPGPPFADTEPDCGVRTEPLNRSAHAPVATPTLSPGRSIPQMDGAGDSASEGVGSGAEDDEVQLLPLPPPMPAPLQPQHQQQRQKQRAEEEVVEISSRLVAPLPAQMRRSAPLKRRPSLPLSTVPSASSSGATVAALAAASSVVVAAAAGSGSGAAPVSKQQLSFSDLSALPPPPPRPCLHFERILESRLFTPGGSSGSSSVVVTPQLQYKMQLCFSDGSLVSEREGGVKWFSAPRITQVRPDLIDMFEQTTSMAGPAGMGMTQRGGGPFPSTSAVAGATTPYKSAAPYSIGATATPRAPVSAPKPKPKSHAKPALPLAPSASPSASASAGPASAAAAATALLLQARSRHISRRPDAAAVSAASVAAATAAAAQAGRYRPAPATNFAPAHVHAARMRARRAQVSDPFMPKQVARLQPPPLHPPPAPAPATASVAVPAPLTFGQALHEIRVNSAAKRRQERALTSARPGAAPSASTPPPSAQSGPLLQSQTPGVQTAPTPVSDPSPSASAFAAAPVAVAASFDVVIPPTPTSIAPSDPLHRSSSAVVAASTDSGLMLPPSSDEEEDNGEEEAPEAATGEVSDGDDVAIAGTEYTESSSSAPPTPQRAAVIVATAAAAAATTAGNTDSAVVSPMQPVLHAANRTGSKEEEGAIAASASEGDGESDNEPGHSHHRHRQHSHLQAQELQPGAPVPATASGPMSPRSQAQQTEHDGSDNGDPDGCASDYFSTRPAAGASQLGSHAPPPWMSAVPHAPSPLRSQRASHAASVSVPPPPPHPLPLPAAVSSRVRRRLDLSARPLPMPFPSTPAALDPAPTPVPAPVAAPPAPTVVQLAPLMSTPTLRAQTPPLTIQSTPEAETEAEATAVHGNGVASQGARAMQVDEPPGAGRAPLTQTISEATRHPVFALSRAESHPVQDEDAPALPAAAGAVVTASSSATSVPTPTAAAIVTPVPLVPSTPAPTMQSLSLPISTASSAGPPPAPERVPAPVARGSMEDDHSAEQRTPPSIHSNKPIPPAAGPAAVTAAAEISATLPSRRRVHTKLYAHDDSPYVLGAPLRFERVELPPATVLHVLRTPPPTVAELMDSCAAHGIWPRGHESAEARQPFFSDVEHYRQYQVALAHAGPLSIHAYAASAMGAPVAAGAAGSAAAGAAAAAAAATAGRGVVQPPPGRAEFMLPLLPTPKPDASLLAEGQAHPAPTFADFHPSRVGVNSGAAEAGGSGSTSNDSLASRFRPTAPPPSVRSSCGFERVVQYAVPPPTLAQLAAASKTWHKELRPVLRAREQERHRRARLRAHREQVKLQRHSDPAKEPATAAAPSLAKAIPLASNSSSDDSESNEDGSDNDGDGGASGGEQPHRLQADLAHSQLLPRPASPKHDESCMMAFSYFQTPAAASATTPRASQQRTPRSSAVMRAGVGAGTEASQRSVSESRTAAPVTPAPSRSALRSSRVDVHGGGGGSTARKRPRPPLPPAPDFSSHLPLPLPLPPSEQQLSELEASNDVGQLAAAEGAEHAGDAEAESESAAPPPSKVARTSRALTSPRMIVPSPSHSLSRPAHTFAAQQTTLGPGADALDLDLHLPTTARSSLRGSHTQRKQLASQLEVPTPVTATPIRYNSSSQGAVGAPLPADIASGSQQHLSILSVEVHACSRGQLQPDPRHDPVAAIFYCIRNQVHGEHEHQPDLIGVLLCPHLPDVATAAAPADTATSSTAGPAAPDAPGAGVRAPQPPPPPRCCPTCSPQCPLPLLGLPASTVVQFFPTELALLSGFATLVQRVDPDVLMGWEMQKGALGYMVERSQALGRRPSMIDDLSRVVPLDLDAHDDQRRRGGAAASAPLERAFHGAERDKSNPASSYAWAHSTGLTIPGRIVLNLWRIMRDELKLCSYTFESCASQILARRFPAFPPFVKDRWFKAGMRARGGLCAAVAASDHSGAQSSSSAAAAAASSSSVDACYSGSGLSRVLHHYLERCVANVEMVDRLDLIGRTAELARVFGIKFFSVLDRGSQYRVESMLLRMSKPQNLLLLSISPGQRAAQPAMECVPLIMEPVSGMYTDPVVVLDFQSLYPSVIIAHNICYSTCLGKVPPATTAAATAAAGGADTSAKAHQRTPMQASRTAVGVAHVPLSQSSLPASQSQHSDVGSQQSQQQQQHSAAGASAAAAPLMPPAIACSPLGSSSLSLSEWSPSGSGLSAEGREEGDPSAPIAPSPPSSVPLGGGRVDRSLPLLGRLQGSGLLHTSANGVMFAAPPVRQGILPRMLSEILATRVMVKKSMGRPEVAQHRGLHRLLNARQFGLKLISNVTYGYTAAGFSGRMPCAEIADAIVQSGRDTLERAIRLVESESRWKARVVYGDTDSLFVLLPGRTRAEAFAIGVEIASRVSASSPAPIRLQMDKVYQPCVLLSKKRYAGFKYEHPAQIEPELETKGIETARRDGCPALVKTLESVLRILMGTGDLTLVRRYMERAWSRIWKGRAGVDDYVFAKEVRVGSYRQPPLGAVLAARLTQIDPRLAPLHAERVPYLIVDGPPGARLVDRLAHPLALALRPDLYRPAAAYYIEAVINRPVMRLLDLLGVDIRAWFAAWPRPRRQALAAPIDTDTGGKAAKKAKAVNGPVGLSAGAAAGPRARPPLLPAPRGGRPAASSSSASALLSPSGTGANARRTIDQYYASQHCALCEQVTQRQRAFCDGCMNRGTAVGAGAAAPGRGVAGLQLARGAWVRLEWSSRVAAAQRSYDAALAACRSCVGETALLSGGGSGGASLCAGPLSLAAPSSISLAHSEAHRLYPCVSLDCPNQFARQSKAHKLHHLQIVAQQLDLEQP